MSTLYVGNISYGTNYNDFRSRFAQFGNVLSVEVKKGYAFVKFEDNAAAEEAIQNLNNSTMDGRVIRVNFSQSEPRPAGQRYSRYNENKQNENNNGDNSAEAPNSNNNNRLTVPFKENGVHVGNLSDEVTKEDLEEAFADCSVLFVHLFTTRNRFAIIELDSSENQKKAIAEKNGQLLKGNRVTVSKQINKEEHLNSFSNFRRGYRFGGRGRGGRGRGFNQNNYYRRESGFRGGYRGYNNRGFRGGGRYNSGRGFRGGRGRGGRGGFNNDYDNNNNSNNNN